MALKVSTVAASCVRVGSIFHCIIVLGLNEYLYVSFEVWICLKQFYIDGTYKRSKEIFTTNVNVLGYNYSSYNNIISVLTVKTY